MSRQSVATEHRVNRRIPVSLDAVLYCNALMLTECWVRDLCLDGAFVLTGGQSLPDCSRVDLAFRLEGGARMSQCFSAKVTRSTEEGVGLRLEHDSPASLRGLVETLYAA